MPFFMNHIPIKLVSSAPPVCTCSGSKKEILLKKRMNNKLRQTINNNLKDKFSCLSNKCIIVNIQLLPIYEEKKNNFS